MKQATGAISVATRGKGLYEFTSEVENWVASSGIRQGLLTVFIQHTSASLLIQENADPDVIRDLRDFFSRIAPEDDGLYTHTVEGPDDMPAHIRAALTSTQLSIPVTDSRAALGTASDSAANGNGGDFDCTGLGRGAGSASQGYVCAAKPLLSMTGLRWRCRLSAPATFSNRLK